MKCPYCNQEMKKGYITSDARLIAWREEKHESANVKKGEGVQLAKKSLAAQPIIRCVLL